MISIFLEVTQKFAILKKIKEKQILLSKKKFQKECFKNLILQYKSALICMTICAHVC